MFLVGIRLLRRLKKKANAPAHRVVSPTGSILRHARGWTGRYGGEPSELLLLPDTQLGHGPLPNGRVDYDRPVVVARMLDPLGWPAHDPVQEVLDRLAIGRPRVVAIQGGAAGRL